MGPPGAVRLLRYAARLLGCRRSRPHGGALPAAQPVQRGLDRGVESGPRDGRVPPRCAGHGPRRGSPAAGWLLAACFPHRDQAGSPAGGGRFARKVANRGTRFDCSRGDRVLTADVPGRTPSRSAIHGANLRADAGRGRVSRGPWFARHRIHLRRDRARAHRLGDPRPALADRLARTQRLGIHRLRGRHRRDV